MMRRLQQRRGFALLAAMWLVVAIATIALEFSLQSRERRETTIDLAERMQAQEAAMAGIETERARFDQVWQQIQRGQAVPGVDTRYPQLSVITALRGGDSGMMAGGGRFSAHLQNGGEWLNVNFMSEDMWRNFLIGAGVSYDAADRLAQAIMDWRDPDDLPRARGAERAAYLHASALVLPTNKNFTSVAQLRDVMGMTPELYAKIAPYLSVCTSGHVDLDDASSPVLRALPGFTDDVVAAVVAERPVLPFNGGGMPPNRIQALFSGGTRQSLLNNSQLIQSVTNASSPWEFVIVSTGWAPGGHTSVTARARITNGFREATINWVCNE